MRPRSRSQLHISDCIYISFMGGEWGAKQIFCDILFPSLDDAAVSLLDENIIQLNFSGTNTDGSFTTATSNWSLSS